MSSALPLPHPPPSPPLTESLCIYVTSSHSCVWHKEIPRLHADNHHGTQVRYKAATGSSWTSSKHLQLGGARPAVGKWVSMRHCVMAFGTGGGGAAGGFSQCSYQRVQSDPQRAHQLHGVFTDSARAHHVVRWKNRCACVCTCAYAISCVCTSSAAVRQEPNGCWW